MEKRPIIFISVVLIIFIAVVLYFVPKITPVQLSMGAVKIDGNGNELGTVQLVMSGSKLDYLFKPSRLDVSIQPFDNITAIKPADYATKFGSIPGMIEPYGSECLYTTYSGYIKENDDLIVAYLAFSPDLTRWAFCDLRESVYYIASVDNEYTTSELIEYFAGLIH